MSEKSTKPTVKKPKPQTANKKKSWVLLSLLLLLLALVVMVVLNYPRFHRWYGVQTVTPTPTYASLSQVQALHRQVNHLQNSVSMLAQQLASQANTAVVNPQTDADWMLADATHLSRLAMYVLQVNADVPTAISLLKTADRQIAALNDSKYQSLRQALIKSITQLQAVPTVDLDGLIAKLVALSQQVETLPMVSTPVQTQAYQEQKTGWQKTLYKLKHVMLIEKNVQGMPAYLSQSQRASLRLHIMQLLSQVQWAVLHRKQTVYQTSLQQIQHLLEHYYVAQDAGTKAMLTSVQELQAIDIAPTLPDLQPSVNVLVAYQHQQGKTPA